MGNLFDEKFDLKIYYSTSQKRHVLKKEIYQGGAHSYNDKTSRIDSILKSLKRDFKVKIISPEKISFDFLMEIHDLDYLEFLRSTEGLAEGQVLCPYVFPFDKRVSVKQLSLPGKAGYYCFDAGSSVMNFTWSSALSSASCALGAAVQTQLTGETTYALCRPPGHHATQNMFGGYCYLNNSAIAAKYLTKFGKVMIIDFDFHHGNGTQSIFYDSKEVFYFSIHAHPAVEYPYFTGFEDEIGIDEGLNYNLNVPLEPFLDSKKYFESFKNALSKAFQVMDPDYIVLSAGFDIEDEDPIGHFNMSKDDFFTLGQMFKQLKKKFVVIQEGGYLVNELGNNVSHFLCGLKS